MAERNNYPKLHNAAWPGVVGKGTQGAEPIIPLDTLLELTANAEADRQKFDGIDLWLADPHISIDSDDDQIKRVADHIASYALKVGSFVAPIWAGAGGGSAMGPPDERKRFVSQVGKAAKIGKRMRELGVRPTGGIRIDSSTSVSEWDKDPKANTKLIAQTFREAAKAA
jgi:sugar phosphate isomerase/epimerase